MAKRAAEASVGSIVETVIELLASCAIDQRGEAAAMNAACNYEYIIDAIISNIAVCGIGAIETVTAEICEIGAIVTCRCHFDQQAGSAGIIIHGETGTEGTASLIIER